MNRPAARWLLAASALSLLAAVAGCSSSDGSDGSSSTTAPGATTAISKVTGAPLPRYADYRSKHYDTPSHWVCRPDTTDDVCDGDLDATEVAADGTLTKQPFRADPNPPIDCFYVYPTISRDPTTYSDWKASDDEEGFATVNQAARLQSACRLFTPVYRQLTLTALGARLGGGTNDPSQKGDPYGDVLDAFRTYMANDNHGRGFVLIGHSQGAGLVAKLIAQEIDPNADVRKELVGAYLAGTSVAVPEGKVVGGDFAHVPLCTTSGQTGCATTWVTFRSTVPPPDNSFFGKPRGTPGESGCVDPAAPSGGTGDADAYFPADASASILSSLGTTGEGRPWVDASAGSIDTPFVRIRGLVTTACTSRNGFHYVAATVHGDPSDPRADDIPGDLTPQWGLHLVDVNLMMGNIVADVAKQAKAFAG